MQTNFMIHHGLRIAYGMDSKVVDYCRPDRFLESAQLLFVAFEVKMKKSEDVQNASMSIQVTR